MNDNLALVENGNGAVKHEGKVKEDPEEDVDAKPPEKKRKKTSNNGAKVKEAARSKKKVETKPENKQKAEPKKSDTAKVAKPKVKYDMPGQTQPTPNSGEPLAKFYLSLYEQRPDSEIAPKWCAIIQPSLYVTAQ